MSKTFVASMPIWIQTSADYASERRTRTLLVKPETTVNEIMQWVASAHVLEKGDVTIIELDTLSEPKS